jgi:hypothetical protein
MTYSKITKTLNELDKQNDPLIRYKYEMMCIKKQQQQVIKELNLLGKMISKSYLLTETTKNNK